MKRSERGLPVFSPSCFFDYLSIQWFKQYAHSRPSYVRIAQEFWCLESNFKVWLKLLLYLFIYLKLLL